jgi:hypothetical protein
MTLVRRSIQSDMAAAARRTRHQIYADARWRGRGGCRDRTLQRANGRCQWPDCPEPATIADHFPISLADVLAHGLDPYDDTNTRALCHRHSGHHDGGRS